MLDIITRNDASVEKNWLKELANAITDPIILLKQLDISQDNWEKGFQARQLFSMRVPQSFVSRMEKGNPNDPLLRQVLPVIEEFDEIDGFFTDPLAEQSNSTPSLLHKYKNRVLLILKTGCAINCRYCFRRHFPYQENPSGKKIWQQHIEYIKNHSEIDEVIFSGGDPLMAKDHELAWLISEIEKIEHVKRLRIHSRLASVLPSRITDELCLLLANSRLQTILVTHINHANEIDFSVSQAMSKLKLSGVILLNQSVLLKDVNDDVLSLKNLSERLFETGILPYYLHLLDRVKGAAHFLVEDDKARELICELLTQTSGYLVPRLTRESAGKLSKTPIDLFLES